MLKIEADPSDLRFDPVPDLRLDPVPDPAPAGVAAEVRATLGQLLEEHRGRVPAHQVRETFEGALEALAGGGAPGAVPELAYRLARERLSRLLPPAGEPAGGPAPAPARTGSPHSM